MDSKPIARDRAGTPRKKAKATKEKPQRERFIEAARRVGVDETHAEFERLFDKVVKIKKP